MITFLQYFNELYMPKVGQTKGVKREDMPQIDRKNHADYVAYLKKSGYDVEEIKIDPKKLKPIQKEFSKEGIKASMERVSKDEQNQPLISVSSDNYILDGHHRWLAYINLDKKVMPVRKIKATMDELLTVTRMYPKVIYKKHGQK